MAGKTGARCEVALRLTGGGKGKGAKIERDHTSLGAQIWLNPTHMPLDHRSYQIPHVQLYLTLDSIPKLPILGRQRRPDLVHPECGVARRQVWSEVNGLTDIEFAS